MYASLCCPRSFLACSNQQCWLGRASSVVFASLACSWTDEEFHWSCILSSVVFLYGLMFVLTMLAIVVMENQEFNSTISGQVLCWLVFSYHFKDVLVWLSSSSSGSTELWGLWCMGLSQLTVKIWMIGQRVCNGVLQVLHCPPRMQSKYGPGDLNMHQFVNSLVVSWVCKRLPMQTTSSYTGIFCDSTNLTFTLIRVWLRRPCERFVDICTCMSACRNECIHLRIFCMYYVGPTSPT